MNQRTVESISSCYGIGIHTGRFINMTIRPAKENTGIVFVRTDVKDTNNIINASYLNVTEASLGTVVSNSSNVKVSTIEHLMAALYGTGVDNAIIEIDGPEVPVMDGSSMPFIFMIDYAGVRNLGVKRKSIKIKKEILIESNNSYIHVEPSEAFEIDMKIDFQNKAIGAQNINFNETSSDFKSEISMARTFGFISEIDGLKSMGLALGASLDNAIGIDDDGNILNEESLRYENEFVRHKILDAVGDFYTSGFSSIVGKFSCSKSGHYTNNLILRKILEDSRNYIVST